MGFFDYLSGLLSSTVIFFLVGSFIVIFCAVAIAAIKRGNFPQVRDAINSTYDSITSIRLPSQRGSFSHVRDGINSTYDSITSRLPSLRLSGRDHLYSRVPSTFAGDMDAGLSSSTFDLSENMEGGDGRAGLDDEAKREILKIMKRRRLPFDQARKFYMEQRFAANGIGADGRPRDPKFVSFS